jgi:hypothetical protein
MTDKFRLGCPGYEFGLIAESFRVCVWLCKKRKLRHLVESFFEKKLSENVALPGPFRKGSRSGRMRHAAPAARPDGAAQEYLP